MKINFNLRKLTRIKTEDLRNRYRGMQAVSSRHDNIRGFDQNKISNACVVIVGLGMNSITAHSCVQKGVGSIFLIDGDTVDPSNLNRQIYHSKDIGRNKAMALAHNLKHMGFMGSELMPVPLFFQAAIEQGHDFAPNVFVVGVDNDETRVYVSRYALEKNIPAIFTAVSADANNGEVFCQIPGQACYVCAHLEAFANRRQPCPGTPATVDIVKVMSGFVSYCVDTVVMDRTRNWNQRVVYLAGILSDEKRMVKRRPGCPLCGNNKQ